MEIEKTNEMNRLFDFYADLLTDKQRTYLDLYYAEDYSLGEIAENYHVSRQAVYDNIRRTEKILLNYEEHLHMIYQYEKRTAVGQKLLDYSLSHYPDDEQLQSMIQELLVIDDENPNEEVS